MRASKTLRNKIQCQPLETGKQNLTNGVNNKKMTYQSGLGPPDH